MAVLGKDDRALAHHHHDIHKLQTVPHPRLGPRFLKCFHSDYNNVPAVSGLMGLRGSATGSGITP